MSATHYSKAPITEALIDIQINSTEVPDLRSLRSFHEEIKSHYPKIGEINTATVQLALGASSASETHQATQIGWMFASQDDKHHFQARTNGATLSRLAPYETWESLVAEFRKLWVETFD